MSQKRSTIELDGQKGRLLLQGSLTLGPWQSHQRYPADEGLTVVLLSVAGLEPATAHFEGVLYQLSYTFRQQFTQSNLVARDRIEQSSLGCKPSTLPLS